MIDLLIRIVSVENKEEDVVEQENETAARPGQHYKTAFECQRSSGH